MKEEIIKVDVKSFYTGIAGGFIASFYTLGPLLLVLAGFDIVQSQILSQYSLPLIIIGIVITAISAMLYKFNATNIITSAVSFAVIFSLIVFVFNAPLASLVYGIDDSADSSAPSIDLTPPPGTSYREVTLSIPGMSCYGCSASIQGILSTTDGIVNASITLENKQGVIIYDTSKITKEEIVNADIFSIYPGEIVSDRAFE